jgi:DNA topoisomerase-6 subunit B
MKRTGGQKTDELLGRDGGGPEGLPDSIIVTAEGIEGEAPVLPGDDGNDGTPSGELQLDMDKSPHPASSMGKAKSAKTTKPTKFKTTGKKNPAKVQPQSAKQMTLSFEKAGTNPKRSQKTGKNHGAKKAKK